MRRLGLLIVALLLAAQGTAAGQNDDPAGGTVDADASSGDGQAEFVVSVVGVEAPWVSAESRCSYMVLDEQAAWDLVLEELGLPPAARPASSAEAPPSRWLIVWCPTDNPLGLSAFVRLAVEPPPMPVMESIARGVLKLPQPQPVFSPAATMFQITGVETWFWLPADSIAPITVTGCTGPLDYACATITATFDHVEADPGDGTPAFACAGTAAFDPALTWSEQATLPHCGHTYTQASGPDAYAVTLTTAWTLEWTCAWDQDLDGTRESPCGGGPLPMTGRNAAPITLEVRDLQARATP